MIIRTPPTQRRILEAPPDKRRPLHEDYHDTIKPALVRRPGDGGSLRRGRGDYRYYVDTGPVLERGWRARAGLGFMGKRDAHLAPPWQLAVSSRRSSRGWNFRRTSPSGKNSAIRENTDETASGCCAASARAASMPARRRVPAAGVVDARRCISYQTIENRGIIRASCARDRHRIYGLRRVPRGVPVEPLCPRRPAAAARRATTSPRSACARSSS